jgi:hypothetical protein
VLRIQAGEHDQGRTVSDGEIRQAAVEETFPDRHASIRTPAERGHRPCQPDGRHDQR